MHNWVRGSLFRIVKQVGAVLILAGLLTGCSLDWPGQARATQNEAPLAVLAQAEVIAEGNLLPRAYAQLSFNYPGKVAEVMVQEGDLVEKGRPMLRLGERDQLEAAVAGAELDLLNAQQALDRLNSKAELARARSGRELAQAELALIQAQKDVDDLDTKDYQDKLDDAWIEVIKARDDVEEAEQELDEYIDLDKGNPTRVRAENRLERAEQTYKERLREYDLLKNRRDQVWAALTLAEANTADLRTEFEARQSGPHPDDLELARATVSSALAQLAAAQAALKDAELVAPYRATLVKLEVVEGEPVLPNQPVVLVADFSEWYVETSDLTEMDVVRIDTEKTVYLSPDAIPDLQISGQVESIAQVFTQSRGDITYTVRVRLAESDPRLRWGMTFKVKFAPLD